LRLVTDPEQMGLPERKKRNRTAANPKDLAMKLISDGFLAQESTPADQEPFRIGEMEPIEDLWDRGLGNTFLDVF
jgi:hypothetical protein